MLNRKPVLVFAILLITMAIVASQVMANLNELEPGESSESMNPDMAYANSGRYLQTAGQYDRNGDGRVDLIIADRNGDSRADYWATDRNFDAKFNDYQYDRNFDGRIDQWEYDLSGNGISDKIYVDADGDGSAELYAMLNPITRTYTWYGNMNSVQASGQMSFPTMPSRSTYQKSYKGGHAADSE
ncbi:MAG: hypothetical protein KKB51_04645 [Candidatus Riflebacteria bacterium]|nr:hypothetical protein [Candidatus Riflebacteria bacterium]